MYFFPFSGCHRKHEDAMAGAGKILPFWTFRFHKRWPTGEKGQNQPRLEWTVKTWRGGNCVHNVLVMTKTVAETNSTIQYKH